MTTTETIQDIPLALLRESTFNPRKTFGLGALADLAESMTQVGVLEPIIVRPKRGKFEIVAGARRFRAAEAAGLPVMPSIVRTLTATEALKQNVIENSQRVDVHPLEECDGYLALQKADKKYTPKVLAAELGRHLSFIYRRMALTDLGPPARKSFRDGSLTAAHAERLARLSRPDQARALETACMTVGLFDKRGDAPEPAPVGKLDAWIAKHVKVEPTEGAQHFFPDLLEAVEHPDSAVMLSESSQPGADLGHAKHKLLGHRRWLEITKPGQRCKHVQRGAVVHGGPVRVIDVCCTKGCPKHFPAPKASPTGTRSTAPPSKPSWEITNEKRERDQKAWDAVKPAMATALAAHLKNFELTPSYVVSRILNDSSEVERLLGGPITLQNQEAAIALSDVLDHAWSRQAFTQATKHLKFNMRPVDTTHAKAQKADSAAEKARAKMTIAKKKPAKKKPAKKRTAKKARR